MSNAFHDPVGALALDESVFPGDGGESEPPPADVRVSVVIPAYNEAANLAYVFSTVAAGSARGDHRRRTLHRRHVRGGAAAAAKRRARRSTWHRQG